MYLIFNSQYANQIADAFSSVGGDGFFDFKPHQKCVEVTAIPTSNTDATPVKIYRTVLVLEVAYFAEQDAQLEAQAKSISDYWTVEAKNVHVFLGLTDTQTTGKTKQEIDILVG